MTNIKKCVGCGSIMQSSDETKLGYVRESKFESSEYCEKCFKMKHYGKTSDEKINLDTEKILSDIVSSGLPIIYIVDVVSITEESIKYLNLFKNNKKYILLTKYDLLPRGVNQNKTIKYFKDNYCSSCEVFCVSSKNKHNIELILNKLRKERINEVYVVGNTNAGKSSFINAMLAINNIKPKISVSPINNTTVSYLKINLDGLTLIDTPGFSYNSITNHLSNEMILKINAKKEIKVKTFQMIKGYSILVDDILRIDYNDGGLNSFNFYMNSNLNYKKIKTIKTNDLKLMPNKTFDIEDKDIVINGLGFIKVNKWANVTVYSYSEDIINVRNKMI